jgi:protein SCO1/2
MINFRKAGLLIATLVIPALIFVFLKLFATNHYDLPYYHPEINAEGSVIVNNGDTLFYTVPSIALMKPDSSAGTAVFGQGKMTLAGYLPEICDDSCKLYLNQLARLSTLGESIDNLQFLTIAQKWNAANADYPEGINTPGWPVLTGTDAEIDSILRNVLKLQTNIPGQKTNSLESKLVLIDTHGHVRGYYNAADAEEADRLMGEIKILDYERKTN